jgi:hypothetical protein
MKYILLSLVTIMTTNIFAQSPAFKDNILTQKQLIKQMTFLVQK